MNRKKTADGILGAAVISCLLAAPFKEVNIWYAGLFHISFAAAVGGFADWFAVSSLFGKPLGISYRTDIIAKRRNKIIGMAEEMVGEELLPAERMETLLKENIPSDLILSWIRNHRESVKTILETIIRSGISAVDKQWLENIFLDKSEKAFQKEDWAGRLAFVLHALKNYENKDILAAVLAGEVKRFLENRFTLAEVRALYLKAWSRYKEKGWFRGLLEQFMEDKEDQAVRVLQENILRIAETLKDPESEVRKALGEAYDGFIQKLTEDEKFRENWNSRIGNAFFSWLKKEGVLHIEKFCKDHEEEGVGKIAEFLLRLGEEQLSGPLKKAQFDAFLLKNCIPYIPWVHEKIKESVVRIMSAYDGREMAELSQKGVDSDVQMIRINGSLCGAVLGFLFYVISAAGGLFS